MENTYPIFKKSVDGETIYMKTFEVSDLDIKSEKDVFYAQGYANTKNKADSYGDIPTNFKGKPVYDLKRMKSNPVMLIDHYNSATNIAGKFIELKEDDNGLYFKLQFRPLKEIHSPGLKDAVQSFISGYAKALSIGGRWLFEDPENPKHLTKAMVHEISGVGIGADPLALMGKPTRKNNEVQNLKRSHRDELEDCIESYLKTDSKSDIDRIEVLYTLINKEGN